MKSLTLPLLALMLATAPATGALAKKDCPPGLAKKNPPCVPPGLAKKGVRADDGDRDYVRRRDDDDAFRPIIWGEDDWRDRWHDRYGRDYYEDPAYVLGPDGRVYEVGDRLDNGAYVRVPLEDLLGLPLVQDGNTYVRVGGKVVEVVETSNQIVRTIGAIHDLLN